MNETFYHTLADGTKTKFTIKSHLIDGLIYYHAFAINIDIESYKNSTKLEQEVFLGIEITNGEGKKINYKDPVRLKTDIINLYGHQNLQTEV